MDERFLIGIILDSNNISVLNAIKTIFVEVFKKAELKCDLMYFYRPDISKMPDRLPQGISQLLTAKPHKIKLLNALKSTFETINAKVDDDFQKWILIITDKYTGEDEFIYSLTFSNQRDTSYIFFGLGEKYNKTSLKNLGVVHHSDEDSLKNNIIDFIDNLIEERKNGRYV
jgi:hypothetical protein